MKRNRHKYEELTPIEFDAEKSRASIIYVAAIAGIDQELYDAARIDGAGRVGCALHVTLPGIMPTMLVLLLLGVADFFTNSRDQMLVFENAINTKNVLTLELYT